MTVVNFRKKDEPEQMPTIRITQENYDKIEKEAVRQTTKNEKIIHMSTVLNEHLEKNFPETKRSAKNDK